MTSKINRNYLVLAICIALAITTFAVFWQVGNHEFISFDDNDYVTENRYVQDGLTLKGIAWAFSEPHAHNWHPLTWLSHMLDCQLFGLNPGRHHLVNLFFHVANTILLFLILRRMTNTLWQSAFVAGLFALHPLHVESVAWVAERKDVLSTFFWMLTMGAYVYYVERPGYKKYLFVLVFFLLGLMSKPMLVTLPFVLLLLDYWPLKRLQTAKAGAGIAAAAPQRASRAKKKKKSRQQPGRDTVNTKSTVGYRALWPEIRPLLKEKIPFFVVAIIFCFVTFYAQHRVVKPMELYPLDGRIANAVISYVSYIGKMLWPLKLSIFYPYVGVAPLSWQAVSAALLLMVATYLTIRAARRFPYLIVGWLWYLGTLVPVIGLVQVGLQSMADRYTYVPLIGIFIMIAWGVPELLNSWRYGRFAIAYAAVAILLACIIMTYVQIGFWRNNIILYEHAIRVTSENAWAQNNLGFALALQGKREEAIAHFQKAISINNPADAHYNLGTMLASQGKLDEAIYQFHESIRISPDYAKAHNNLGNALLYQGRLDEAIASYREAMRLNPDYTLAQENLKNALAVQKKFR
ncbi:MAG: tetratricopeptide repeat protein [Syntrophales bacterium LBB04]|nr:tetratricopeptide repeat protein [Syntrophales bacterium LBB04]